MKQKMLMTALPLLLIATACATTTDVAVVPGAHPETDIAGVVATANQGEIEQGNAAAARAATAEVRSFAQMMVADHTAALQNGQAVFSAAGITPGENDTTRILRDNSRLTVTNLATYSGTAYDRTYMQSQVDLHQWLLNALDTALIPSARTAELRTLLTTQRASVAAHLEQARAIRGRL